MKTFKLIPLFFLIPVLTGYSVLMAKTDTRNEELEEVWESFILFWEKYDNVLWKIKQLIFNQAP
ncbi:hypothetical protein [Cecembia lonarensis]|uniref:Uncharacterized protein n=1 Tax=Cecembia lonarensis (strain CCUG 58316 / KCTC 22772 / LW9) TaxID=1225176 RepID=K1L4F3_CECL9|nr:hypothetical protein [Cecembia lonarensis]EKB51260.1 hypothetical protein B879_00054 [Cecembia lonarensis LW9]